LRPRDDDYTHSYPEPDDILLVIEVSDTSAEYDRAVTMPLYAWAGVPEAWLVDLNRGLIEGYRRPGEAGYGEKQTYAAGEQLSVQALPGLALGMDEILGLT
jgi:Uma2 family endonuclease